MAARFPGEDLDALQRRTWIRFSGVAQGIPAEITSRMVATTGLTQYEYLVFNHLNLSEGHSMPLSRLALLLASSLSRLSHVVSRLEADGRLSRSRSPEDGRVQIVTMTERGVEEFRAAAPAYFAAVGDLFFERLDRDDLGALDRIMSKLLPGVDAGGVLAPIADRVAANAHRKRPANAQTLGA
ncbi:MAG: putative MarR-family transcriptional regulator [Schumannella sp.]|nr:putative MarR-family transcriptional regulator [Schumannella sp.]